MASVATNQEYMIKRKLWIKSNPIRKARKKHDLTLTQAASIIGVSLLSLNLWEQGNAQPKPENLNRAARALKIAPEEMEAQWKEWDKRRPTF